MSFTPGNPSPLRGDRLTKPYGQMNNVGNVQTSRVPVSAAWSSYNSQQHNPISRSLSPVPPSAPGASSHAHSITLPTQSSGTPRQHWTLRSRVASPEAKTKDPVTLPMPTGVEIARDRYNTATSIVSQTMLHHDGTTGRLATLQARLQRREAALSVSQDLQGTPVSTDTRDDANDDSMAKSIRRSVSTPAKAANADTDESMLDRVAALESRLETLLGGLDARFEAQAREQRNRLDEETTSLRQSARDSSQAVQNQLNIQFDTVQKDCQKCLDEVHKLSQSINQHVVTRESEQMSVRHVEQVIGELDTRFEAHALEHQRRLDSAMTSVRQSSLDANQALQSQLNVQLSTSQKECLEELQKLGESLSRHATSRDAALDTQMSAFREMQDGFNARLALLTDHVENRAREQVTSMQSLVEELAPGLQLVDALGPRLELAENSIAEISRSLSSAFGAARQQTDIEKCEMVDAKTILAAMADAKTVLPALPESPQSMALEDGESVIAHIDKESQGTQGGTAGRRKGAGVQSSTRSSAAKTVDSSPDGPRFPRSAAPPASEGVRTSRPPSADKSRPGSNGPVRPAVKSSTSSNPSPKSPRGVSFSGV
eukprot:gnl/TRDRNA2_/TRDRNA2_81392_c1_seq1.p1 gnl/TRDRNA2_/TRDRNA2_81392_c1~~gnl/TRDRNA2_/TRDRNA2_81392_c1_seq1.p1  ORF type:complete len:600 (+),score=73.32 gnl/TRDRNA2_/TRDRNA2_81392_c1_seq1:60-1859(+)